MNSFLEPINTVQRAIWGRRFPDDIAHALQENLQTFQTDPALFDTPDLQGPAKQAELIVKLGYWLVLGHLTDDEFRKSVERIPPVENGGWDVDLCPREPHSVLPRILKLGRFDRPQESDLVRQA